MEQASLPSRLDAITVSRVSAGDLLDKRVANYVVAVIMAPMPDAEQKPEVASNVLAALNTGKGEAWWIMGADGRRVGVIVFSVGDYGASKRDTRVLYIIGFSFPGNAPQSAWASLIAHGRQVAKERGCQYIMFDVAPNGPYTEGIIRAGLEARAQVRFTLEA